MTVAIGYRSWWRPGQVHWWLKSLQVAGYSLTLKTHSLVQYRLEETSLYLGKVLLNIPLGTHLQCSNFKYLIHFERIIMFPLLATYVIWLCFY